MKKLSVFLLLASLNVSAEICDFDNSISKALCLGTIGVIGGTVIGMEKLKDAIPTKSHDVLIKLESGEILPGKLSGHELRNRTLVDGVPLNLRCRIYNLDGLAYMCNLSFPKLKPILKSPDYYERTGTQLDMMFSIKKDGAINKNILDLPRSLQCNDENCI